MGFAVSGAPGSGAAAAGAQAAANLGIGATAAAAAPTVQPTVTPTGTNGPQVEAANAGSVPPVTPAYSTTPAPPQTQQSVSAAKAPSVPLGVPASAQVNNSNLGIPITLGWVNSLY